MSHILHKCWAGEYDSVCEVLGDPEVVRKGLMAEGCRGKSVQLEAGNSQGGNEHC